MKVHTRWYWPFTDMMCVPIVRVNGPNYLTLKVKNWFYLIILSVKVDLNMLDNWIIYFICFPWPHPCLITQGPGIDVRCKCALSISRQMWHPLTKDMIRLSCFARCHTELSLTSPAGISVAWTWGSALTPFRRSYYPGNMLSSSINAHVDRAGWVGYCSGRKRWINAFGIPPVFPLPSYSQGQW